MVPLKALLGLMAMVAMFKIVSGKNYTVGAPNGSWDLNTNYTKWASDNTFHPGDNLLFNYTSAHDVWEVTKGDYDTCTKVSPIMTYTGGNTLISLTEIGSRYFFCSTGSHCASGQKLEVLVVSSETPSAPSSSPPPPSQKSSPPPSPKSSSPPPKDSPPLPPPKSFSPPSAASPPPAPNVGVHQRNNRISVAIALAFGVTLMIVI